MRKTYSLYKLRFTSPLHIGDCRGDYGNSLTTVASDTFYAAITATLAKLGKDIPDNGDLGFVMSSLFPFFQKDKASESVLFFPRPLRCKPFQADDPTDNKLLKKVAWVDKCSFEKMLAGSSLGNIKEYIHKTFLSSVKIADSTERDDSKEIKIDNFVHSQVVQRVKIEMGKDTVPFYVDRVSFRGESGLFFLAEGNVELLEEALPLLALEGVGTDRSVGYGQFEFEKEQLDMDVPDNAQYQMSLSNFIPESSEQLKGLVGDLKKSQVAYDFVRRGGWITTPPYITFRKNVIYAFVPGSTFLGSDASAKGRFVDLKPEACKELPVWRCGKAIFLPTNINIDDHANK